VAHIGETLRGNTEGRKFVVETHFARLARETTLSSLQRELIVGSLLGDAYLMPTTSGFCFRVNHGMQQRDYVDWKFNMLAKLVRTPPRESGKMLLLSHYHSSRVFSLPGKLLFRQSQDNSD